MKPLHRKLFSAFIALGLLALACSTFSIPFQEDQAPAASTENSSASDTTSDQQPGSGTETETDSPSVFPTTAPTKEAPTEVSDLVPSNSLGETFVPFWEAWDYLHQYFVDQPLDDEVLVNGAIQGLSDHAEIGTLEVGDNVAEDFANAADTPRDAEDVFSPFWKVWANSSGEAEVVLMRHALTGMVASLNDDYTIYLDPDRQIQANINLEGSYEGIGAFVDTESEYLTIISPIAGSPAEAAGLQPGDEIIAVDGEDMTGIDGSLVIQRVVGPAGTEVILTIRREGVEEPFDVSIIRATITFPNLSGEILEESNLAYVQFYNFSSTAGEELHTLLEELLAQNPDGLIFDLRGNPGGYLTTAIEVISEFIDEGVVMYERYSDGSEDVYEALGDGLATDIPLVILVDGGSASASEIVAGSIQDYERAPVVGVTTFGKGSVQILLTLSDNSGLRVTIAKWLTPDERQISGIGLTPDVIVEITEDDIAAGTDPQLQKAIELLTEDA